MKIHLAVNSGFIQKYAEIAAICDDKENHLFIVYGEQMTGQIIDTKKLDNNFIVVEKLEDAKTTFEEFFEKTTTLHLHFLSNEVIAFLNTFDISKKKIVWYFWGSDAYSLPEVYSKIKQYRTDYFREALGKVKRLFKPIISSKTKLDFLKTIDVVAHYSMDDYNLIKHLLKKEAVFKYFTYGAIEYIVDFDTQVSGNDILLGNSASLNNHHIYTINKLLPQQLNKKVFCPLSYGGNEGYVSKVIQAGKKKLGDSFIAINKLIDTKVYHQEILTKAKYALMPHNRSQAWGNIMQLLWQGSLVFMFPSNNLYKFLKQNGFKVFELTKGNLENLNNLSIEAGYNRNLLIEQFSFNQLIPSYKAVLSI